MDGFRAEQLAGKVAYVAGGTRGINLAIAERFAQHGARVVVVGRDGDRAKSAATQVSAHGPVCLGLNADVRDYAAVADTIAQTVEAFGLIDIVVSGAAGNFLAGAASMSSNAFRAVVDIDLIGTFNVYRACFDSLRRPGAALLSISSGLAIMPRRMQAHACAAKAGVNMLTKCLALEWGPQGVRVNGLSPGPIEDTEGVARLIPTLELRARFARSIPLQRFGARADIADAALFLCSEAASYISGTILSCDGGSDLGDAGPDPFEESV